MITGVHTLVYGPDPEAARAFFRDVLRFPAVETSPGWLICRTGPSEIGAHPDQWDGGGTDQHFDVSLICDDLEATMADLASRGAEFDGGVVEQPWGMTVRLVVPGGQTMVLYEPAYDPPALLAD